ncbi:phosphoenolpyruvate-dependent PTS family enzyme IIA component [Klebsiella quasipneumoniae]|nr:phosphoenolpyruvate-dependent PTS family enzyme IIA component [Klebsiella quasipneumoniae]
MIDNITLDNLHIGCKASNKAEVIAMIGAECKAKGALLNKSDFG